MTDAVHPKNAYEQGQMARHDDQPGNPYSMFSEPDAYSRWNEGWNAGGWENVARSPEFFMLHGAEAKTRRLFDPVRLVGPHFALIADVFSVQYTSALTVSRIQQIVAALADLPDEPDLSKHLRTLAGMGVLRSRVIARVRHYEVAL